MHSGAPLDGIAHGFLVAEPGAGDQGVLDMVFQRVVLVEHRAEMPPWARSVLPLDSASLETTVTTWRGQQAQGAGQTGAATENQDFTVRAWQWMGAGLGE